MTPRAASLVLIAVLGTIAPLAEARPPASPAAPPLPTPAPGDTVRVAPPTGEPNDRASILAALERVRPAGAVQFAPGTYLIGEIIHITVPGITVLGHPEGTILRGCNPEDGTLDRMLEAVVQCNGLDMAGGHQTVRNVTFEHAWHPLTLGGLECRIPGGCRPHGEPVESRDGGYRVEGNTFRAVANGVRTLGEWDDPAVIRDNEFIDTFHAVVVHGSTVHVLANDITAPRPERVPSAGHPGGAVLLSATDLNLELSLRCAGNVIEGNRVDGHPSAIGIWLLRPGTSCRDNVIRGNTIRVARVPASAGKTGDPSAAAADSSAVGIPISLVGSPEPFGLTLDSAGATDRDGVLEDNLIEGNRILGAEGLGIELFRASRNRIRDNAILDVRRREPFPGRTVNSTDPEKSGWRDANGSGIWLSPGSDGNEIVGNSFEDIALHAVVLEGDSNRVEKLSAKDSVLDPQSGNRVTGPSRSVQDAVVSAPPALNDGWEVAAPADVGLEPSRLAALTEALRAGEFGNVHALLIEREGKLTYEEYFEGEDRSWGSELGRVRFGRASLHDLRSVSKAVTSTLVGIAIDRGEIESVDVPLYRLLPDHAHLLRGEKRKIRLRHVLTMSAGLEWDEWSVPYTDPANDESRMYDRPDPVAYVLERRRVEEPGTRFNYSGGLTQVLAAVLEEATGREFEKYAREVLFRPLGIYDAVWRSEDGETPAAASGLRLRARDLAKLGSVFLNGGLWGDRRVVSEEWVMRATSHHLPVELEYVPDFATHVGYGYQWWHLTYKTPRGQVESPSAVGNGDQRLILLPDLGLSVTLLAGLYNTSDPEELWMPDRLLVEHILPAAHAGAEVQR